MKKKYAGLSEKVRLVGMCKSGKGLVDYYIAQPGSEMIYAFTRPYARNAYNICKSGISIKTLLCKKTRDTGIMKLIRYTTYMMPYFLEEYELMDVT